MVNGNDAKEKYETLMASKELNLKVPVITSKPKNYESLRRKVDKTYTDKFVEDESGLIIDIIKTKLPPEFYHRAGHFLPKMPILFHRIVIGTVGLNSHLENRFPTIKIDHSPGGSYSASKIGSMRCY